MATIQAAEPVEHLGLTERAALGRAARAEVHAAPTPAGRRRRTRSRARRAARAAGGDARPGTGPDPLAAACSSPPSPSTAAPPTDGASDPPALPRTGLDDQLCGDAHLSNFGAYAAPDRDLVFDINELRRDAAGAVRVGPQAAGRELRRRGTRTAASSSGSGRRSSSPRRARIARRCGSTRMATSTSGTPASRDELLRRVRRSRLRRSS